MRELVAVLILLLPEVMAGSTARAASVTHENSDTETIYCARPYHLDSARNSHIMDLGSKSFVYMERITVECNDWYEMTAGCATWRCDENGQWAKDCNMKAPNPPEDIPVCRPKCGQRLVQEDAFEGQIAGGKKVKKQGGWPWMAFIDFGGGRSGSDYCGGVLIDERTVVTAANCLQNHDDDEYVYVWLGFLNRANDNFDFTQRFIVPPPKRYSDRRYGEQATFDADIAILKLDRPVEFSFYVHPICLPSLQLHEELVNRYRAEGLNAVLTGWGSTEDRTFPEDLMKTRLAFADWNVCQEQYRAIFPDIELLTENMICAGFEHGLNDACKGDSGSPLMTKDDSDRWYLNGITSFGDATSARSCGRVRAYGVYTVVPKFHDFLRLHMEKGI